MEARGSSGPASGAPRQGLRGIYDDLPPAATNWLVVVLGVLVIGCSLMVVAAMRLLSFDPVPTSSVSVLLRADFDGAAEPFPDTAEDGFTTSVASGSYVLSTTGAGGGSAIRTAGLASETTAVETTADTSRAVAAGAQTTAVVGVACLDTAGERGYALLSDGTGNYTLAKVAGSALTTLATAQGPEMATDAPTRLDLTCVPQEASATGTLLVGSVDGVALLEAEDAAAPGFGQAGLVAISDGAGATATFDDVLALVPAGS